VGVASTTATPFPSTDIYQDYVVTLYAFRGGFCLTSGRTEEALGGTRAGSPIPLSFFTGLIVLFQ
jgi:hypothetical protein